MSIKKQVKINVAIGIFYLISGVWEYLVGLFHGESVLKSCFLLDVYRSYAEHLGIITIFVGIAFLILPRFTRWLVLILAWWNLFTAPIIDVWWSIYSISIKKISVTNSWLGLWLYTFVLISLLSLIRIYIIYKLRVPKKGQSPSATKIGGQVGESP